MGSRRIGQVRFQAISGDHIGEAVPHLHAHIGGGEVAIELTPNGGVRLSQAHKRVIRGQITSREIAIVLRTARQAHDELVALWKESRP